METVVRVEVSRNIYMSFLNMEKPRRLVPGFGPPDAKIAIVGEAPGAYEDAQLKPFVGPAGTILEQCLHAAGLIRSDVYLTNVVKVRPPKNDISNYFNGRTFSEAGMEWVQLLREELNAHGCNVIVACGAVPMAALIGRYKITKLRGYIFESIELTPLRKVIPTIHPAASMYDRKGGQKGALATSEFKPYLYRHVIASDLKKAKAESQFRELRRPERQLVYEFGSVEEVLEWLEYYEKQPIVSVDIESPRSIGEMICIGFSSKPNLGISVPLDSRWSETDELLIWRAIQRVLKSDSIKVFQNGVFDTWFLLTRYGFETAGEIRDTMIAHSVMYPELPKKLEFLGSVYCGAQEYWKGKVKFDELKEEA